MNRDEYYTALQTNTQELKHYGVLGMKWGMHKARKIENSSEREAAIRDIYAKANSKRVRLLSKAAKLNNRRQNLDKKIKNLTNVVYMPGPSADKAIRKTNALIAKKQSVEKEMNKYRSKGDTWTKHMEKEFSKVSIQSLTKESIDSGEEWVKFILKQNLK